MEIKTHKAGNPFARKRVDELDSISEFQAAHIDEIDLDYQRNPFRAKSSTSNLGFSLADFIQ